MSLSTLRQKASELAEYCEFSPAPDDLKSILKTKFLEDLAKTKTIDGLGDQLIAPIEDALDEKFKMSFYIPIMKLDHPLGWPSSHALFILDNSPILVMFSAHVDFKLEMMGKKHNFPRGFPIVWRNNAYIDFFGFRAKFKNDDRATRMKITAKGFAYSKKLSGYLGQVFALEIDGELFWTACSKNSADSVAPGVHRGVNFAADAARLYQPYMTKTLVKHMFDNNLHFCSEMLSKYDKHHGADVLMEAPVTTTGGKGVKVDLETGVVRDLPKRGYTTFLPFHELIETCDQLGLPVCEAVIVTGKGGNELFERLQEVRDELTNDMYDQILSEISTKNPGHVTIIMGNTNHAELLGNTLEGLVVQAILDTEENAHLDTPKKVEEALDLGLGDIFKYKLANYVALTMGFRTMMDKKMTLTTCEPHITSFVEHWCLSDEGKEYWTRFLWQCMIKYMAEQDSKTTPTPASYPSEMVGHHIRISEEIKTNGFDTNLDMLIAKYQRETVFPKGPYTIVAPFASNEEVTGLAKRIESELKIHAVTKAQRPKSRQIMGWIHVAKNLTVPSDSTGPVFQLPYPDNLVGWQEKKIAEVSKLAGFAEIHQVPNFSGFKTALNEVLMAEREPEDTVDEECNQIELALQESASATTTYIDGIIRQCIEASKRAVFILVGPQAVGKSFIVDKLVETFGEELIAHCSADKHMGAKFNPMMLDRVHKLCQMDCFNALRDGKFAIIDNTSMEAAHRTIYNYEATTMNADCYSIGVGTEFWMSEDECVRNTCIDALELRAKKRAINSGKVIERYVIENAISKARADFKRFNSLPEKKKQEFASNWFEYYPKSEFAKGITIDSSTLKFRSEELSKWCQVMFDSYIWSGEAPENIIKMRLQYEIMRGIEDFYTTILNPNELRKVTKEFKKKGEKFPKTSEIVIEGEPEIIGLGEVKSDVDEKHALFVVLNWEQAQLYRESLGLSRKHFHVTLAFEKDDVHRTSDGKDVDKSKVIFTI